MKCVGGPFDGKDINSRSDVLRLEGHDGRYVRWRALHEVERHYLWRDVGEDSEPPRVKAIRELLG